MSTDTTPDSPSADYARIAAAITFVADNWREQPDLETIARAVDLSPHHFQRLFSRWAGVSPKKLVAYLTREHARSLLLADASVLDAALDSGLSGPSRLHDLFVTTEAITPGEVRGRGLDIRWGVTPSPFGTALFFISPRGLMGLAFADGAIETAFADMAGRWPAACFTRDDAAVAPIAARIFGGANRPLTLHLHGTPWQLAVWEALLRIPEGACVSYRDIARRVCTVKASRAVGAAVGRNPVSFVIPCHRVLATNGAITGYHWGTARKQAMLAFEAARRDALSASAAA